MNEMTVVVNGGIVAAFEAAQSVAETFANSSIVPAHYRGNIANCVLAVEMSTRFGIHPFMFMQKTYIVSGKLAMEGQLVIAIINNQAPIKGRINWKFEGSAGTDGSKCTAYVTDLNDQILSVTLHWSHVKNEGWTSNKKWLSMPDVMMRYRSAAMLARAYFPDVLMGMWTADEAEDVYGKPIEQLVVSDNTPSGSSNKRKSDLADILDTPVVNSDEAQNPDVILAKLSSNWQSLADIATACKADEARVLSLLMMSVEQGDVEEDEFEGDHVFRITQ